MRQIVPFLLLAVVAVASGQTDGQGPLLGTMAAGVYTSPTGAFKMEVPVLPALGGIVTDTNNVVTFHDDYGLQITVGAFPQDASLKWEYSTRGNKDYLIYFFSNFVLEDFKRFFPGTHIESAGFSPDFLEGALFTYVLMPGGSVVGNRAAFTPSGQVPEAKRGNLVFVKNGFTFVISTELSERVTEGKHYNKSTEEENLILRGRLAGVVRKMQFLNQAPAK
jgi:hypothetical protein